MIEGIFFQSLVVICKRSPSPVFSLLLIKLTTTNFCFPGKTFFSTLFMKVDGVWLFAYGLFMFLMYVQFTQLLHLFVRRYFVPWTSNSFLRKRIQSLRILQFYDSWACWLKSLRVILLVSSPSSLPQKDKKEKTEGGIFLSRSSQLAKVLGCVQYGGMYFPRKHFLGKQVVSYLLSCVRYKLTNLKKKRKIVLSSVFK